MPSTIAAARAGATTGEWAETLRDYKTMQAFLDYELSSPGQFGHGFHLEYYRCPILPGFYSHTDQFFHKES